MKEFRGIKRDATEKIPGISTQNLKYGNYRETCPENFDDDVSFYNDNITPYKNDVRKKEVGIKDRESTGNEEILYKLNFIIEKLAKLERRLDYDSTLLQNRSSSNIFSKNDLISDTGVSNSSSINQNKSQGNGSMLKEIQEIIGKMPSTAFGSPVGPMSEGVTDLTPRIEGTNQPAIQEDIVSSIATLPPSSYDDDCPNIIGLD